MAEVLGVIGGIAGLVIMFKPLFGNMTEFLDCVKFWFTPDVVSLFRGEWSEDRHAEFKLVIWLVIGAATGFAVYTLFNKIIG